MNEPTEQAITLLGGYHDRAQEIVELSQMFFPLAVVRSANVEKVMGFDIDSNDPAAFSDVLDAVGIHAGASEAYGVLMMYPGTVPHPVTEGRRVRVVMMALAVWDGDEEVSTWGYAAPLTKAPETGKLSLADFDPRGVRDGATPQLRQIIETWTGYLSAPEDIQKKGMAAVETVFGGDWKVMPLPSSNIMH